MAELMRRQCLFHQERKGKHRPDGREHQRTRPATGGFQAPLPQTEGIKRLKRGADIPIAVLVPRSCSGSASMSSAGRGSHPRLAAAVEKQISTVD